MHRERLAKDFLRLSRAAHVPEGHANVERGVQIGRLEPPDALPQRHRLLGPPSREEGLRTLGDGADVAVGHECQPRPRDAPQQFRSLWFRHKLEA